MTQFLSDSAVLKEISKGLKAGPADLAVAFWGKNAARTLRLTNVKQTLRIICDAYSGACNPDELRVLLGNRKVEIKWLNGLHAKVYILPDVVIVGSANASANGLGDESMEAKNTEAAALTTDERFRAAAKQWFEKLWSSADAVSLTEAHIEEIRRRWKLRQLARAKDRQVQVRALSRKTKILNALDNNNVVIGRWRRGPPDTGATIGGAWPRPEKRCEIIRVFNSSSNVSIVGGPILRDEPLEGGRRRIRFRDDPLQRGHAKPPNGFKENGTRQTFENR